MRPANISQRARAETRYIRHETSGRFGIASKPCGKGGLAKSSVAIQYVCRDSGFQPTVLQLPLTSEGATPFPILIIKG